MPMLGRRYLTSSIRFKFIVWFLAISLIPMALIGLLAYVQAKRSLEAQIADRLGGAAKVGMEQLDRFFFERLGNLREWADDKTLKEDLTAGARRRLADKFTHWVRTYLVMDFVGVYDARGRLIAMNDKDAQGKPLPVQKVQGMVRSGEAWHPGAQAGFLYLQDLHVSPLAKVLGLGERRVVGLAAPLDFGGGARRQTGVLYVEIGWERVQDLLDQARECADLLKPDQPEAAEHVAYFLEFAKSASPGQLEEIYTGTFDLNPACYIFAGYLLFGESFNNS